MDAVEKLEAAIDKLEELKAKAHPGRWKHEHWPNDAGTIDAILDVDSSLMVQTGEGFERDGDLIVTLHRTIDAQLAVLRAAWSANDDFELTRGDYKGRGPLKVTPLGVAVVALADAILGGDNS